ncbi:hypothetical protein EJ08DRAFT_293950 [Tothia fuscella]|uniref:Uncharacterized protein n=1 Tax=Tothia fuscella TaxID=1048955 RepID=A0A9P4P275_9PEZI|nr:hypothetical protein EJ08DRAFT_293950 [Tothia fuscella]
MDLRLFDHRSGKGRTPLPEHSCSPLHFEYATFLMIIAVLLFVCKCNRRIYAYN